MLSWLHISDIHFNKKNDWKNSECRSSLLKLVRENIAANKIKEPDFIFCTGDIAFGQMSEDSLLDQYSSAKKFFDELLVACGKDGVSLSKERLFIVPGNHDININSINTDMQYVLDMWSQNPHANVSKINQRFEDRPIEFLDSVKRLNEYNAFVKEYLPQLHDEFCRGVYTRIVEKNGKKIAISGFNSAWCCSGSGDNKNIWTAIDWQLANAKKSAGDADFRIGLIHHPKEYFNSAEAEIANQQISLNYDVWLHGHSHSAWVMPMQNHIAIAAGATGAGSTDEFGFNFTEFGLEAGKGHVHLYGKRASHTEWSSMSIPEYASNGVWEFSLNNKNDLIDNNNEHDYIVDKYLNERFNLSLKTFSTQPKVWVYPTLSKSNEVSAESKNAEKIDCLDLIENPRSVIIKSPPQYGQTCLAYYLTLEAWRKNKNIWIYLDVKQLKATNYSIDSAVQDELNRFGGNISDVNCIVIDSWDYGEKDAIKILNKISEKFLKIPIICMRQIEGIVFKDDKSKYFPERAWEVIYLWSLSRSGLREIVSKCNEEHYIGDEDVVTSRLVSDMAVLNLHRTALNCLTLLKVFEQGFDESPVNRSEIIKRVLSLLFNVDDIPAYKSRPDLKDCEFVLGYFCEDLIRNGRYFFSREEFLKSLRKCADDNLLDIETHLVFDVLFENNILILIGGDFCFKFAYWIFYFAAQRMLQNEEFATFVLEDKKYAQYPELIEFYTGIDRNRGDALNIIINDLSLCNKNANDSCGFPESFNPYRFARWEASTQAQEEMKNEIINGIKESSLPSDVKDKYADVSYDPSKPYTQNVGSILDGNSFQTHFQLIKSAAKALRNSDYVPRDTKIKLMREILVGWGCLTKVMFIILPELAMDTTATYNGTGFVLLGDFGETPLERIVRILNVIPDNVISWFCDDIFSQKMAPLLFSGLDGEGVSDIVRHELILLLIKNKPKKWNIHVSSYISNVSKNSFYLFDVYRKLRSEYRYCFASNATLKEMEVLIKFAADRHVKYLGGSKQSGRGNRGGYLGDELIPQREV